MPNSIFLSTVPILIVILIITILRLSIKKRALHYSDKISHIPSYSSNFTNYSLEESPFIDIPTDLNNVYFACILSSSETERFVNHYKPYFLEANSIFKKLQSCHIKAPENLLNFVHDFKNINELIQNHNQEAIAYILKTHKDFFDHCLQYPLDPQQRRSIISEEDNCLVVSSAGSGKTSSIVGKVKYLTEIKGVSPCRILLISYTNKAAAELTERINTENLKGFTFHKLALDIIGKKTGIKPSICSNTDTLFIDIYHTLLKNKAFKKSAVEYFADYQTFESEFEHLKNKRREQLSEQKKAQIKAIFPDMDGKSIYVRSIQEQKICFALSSLGIKFRYEEPYEHPIADETHSQYHPDFSIYYEQDGINKRIYLEHFGIDEHGLVPVWFAQDLNISYQEACQKYNDGITWKIAAHKKFGTRLLTTSSADFHYSDIQNTLKQLLTDAGVPIIEKSEDELFELILPSDSKQEKAFIRLIATFVTLIKSSCKSIDEVLLHANKSNDKRSSFIIQNIFQPVYTLYQQTLSDRKQIDFTDAILQATEICRISHPVEYDYIIVDEFQDISIDRYNFLKVLRNGNPPAKLYCVGDDWQSIYRFSGSDMALFNKFPEHFGTTEINKIETTYRFGEPLVSLSSKFIQRNTIQIQKDIRPFNAETKTELMFYAYNKNNYCSIIEQLLTYIPSDKSVFLLGRYSFDDYFLSFCYKSIKEGNKFYYIINGRKLEFLTAHKSKGLEADYVILLQCNKDTYGFPSLINDDPVLRHVLTENDKFPHGEERRLFYVAITRAKIKTFVLYDNKFPSAFVEEFLHPEKISFGNYLKHPNANKRWTRNADQFLLKLHKEGKSIKEIAEKMGRSQTSITIRLNKFLQ